MGREILGANQILDQLSGQPKIRVTVTAVQGAAKDNTGAGADAAYTFRGNETLALQPDKDIYVQFVAEAGYTAAGAGGVMLRAGTFKAWRLNGATKITVEPVAVGETAVVKMFELS